MNVNELQAKLIEAVNDGRLDVESLEDYNSSCSAPSACADFGAASSPSLVARLRQQLADSLQLVNSSKPFAAMFSYDGGLECSFYGDWVSMPSGNFALDVLKRLKEKVQEVQEAVPFVVGDCAFWLLPQGARSGYGSYSYVLVMEDEGRAKYRFLLHRSPCKSIAGIRVKCEYGAFRRCKKLSQVRDEIMHVLDVLGFKVERYCLSRIDFNLTVNHSMSFINQAYNDDRITNRCTEVALAGGRRVFKSYRIGKLSTIQLAIYDKTKELLDRYDHDKVEDLAFYLGSPVGQNWTRYEFRLGRVFLHSIDVETFDDYIENELAIVNYLTLYWFNVRKRRSRTGKTKSYKLDSWWILLRYAFLYAVSSGNYAIREVEFNNLRGSGFGSGSSLLAGAKVAIDKIKHYRTFLEINNELPRINRLPRRHIRKNLKQLFRVSLGCLVSAVIKSSPSNCMLDKVAFKKSVCRSVEYLSDEAFDRYCKEFMKINGNIKRNYDLGYVDVPSLIGGKQ